MFSMIKTANRALAEAAATASYVQANLTVLAETQNQTAEILAENVTHVLANIANAAQQGEELKLMHTNSIAAFLAGVETLAQKLPDQSPDKSANALRVLAAASIDPDGYVTYATTPVAQLGARNEPVMQKYQKVVNDYVTSQSRGQPDGTQLAQLARKLQMNIDRAMRIAATNSGPKNAPGETTFTPDVAAAQRG